jgi:hypothetical protein
VPFISRASATAPDGSPPSARRARSARDEGASVEVVIRWGHDALHVVHLTPPRSFAVGEGEGKRRVDFALPEAMLGAKRAPVVLARGGGAVALVLLPNATGILRMPGQPPRTVDEAKALGLARPSEAAPGAHEIPLVAGMSAAIDVNGIGFDVTRGPVGTSAAGRAKLDRSAIASHAGSLVLHAGLLGAMVVFAPPFALNDDMTPTPDHHYAIRHALESAAERDQKVALVDQRAKPTEPSGAEGGTGAQAASESGVMGSPRASAGQDRRYGVSGAKTEEHAQLSRRAALDDAAAFGMVGLLASQLGGDPNAPIAPFGADFSLGHDPKSALGNLWGAEIGEAAGAGGLGLTGTGEGAGGRGEGIGLGSLGVIGHGAGLGSRQSFGNGHRVRAPVVRCGTSDDATGPSGGCTAGVSGRLPPEVIQRVVRQNFGRFRLCYENGLRSCPNLQGRVAVRFVIGRDGSVSSAADGGSDMADRGVAACVVKAFYGLSFPAPEGGIVTVSYPIMFSPGE